MRKIKNSLIVRSRSARFIIVSKMMERDWVRYVYSTSGSNQVCISQYHYRPFYINKRNRILKIKHSQTYMSCFKTLNACFQILYCIVFSGYNQYTLIKRVYMYKLLFPVVVKNTLVIFQSPGLPIAIGCSPLSCVVVRLVLSI